MERELLPRSRQRQRPKKSTKPPSRLVMPLCSLRGQARPNRPWGSSLATSCQDKKLHWRSSLSSSLKSYLVISNLRCLSLFILIIEIWDPTQHLITASSWNCRSSRSFPTQAFPLTPRSSTIKTPKQRPLPRVLQAARSSTISGPMKILLHSCCTERMMNWPSTLYSRGTKSQLIFLSCRLSGIRSQEQPQTKWLFNGTDTLNNTQTANMRTFCSFSLLTGVNRWKKIGGSRLWSMQSGFS